MLPLSGKQQSSIQNSSSDFLKHLKLDQLKVSVDLAATPLKLNIDLSQLDLPQPYSTITKLNISCPALTIEEQIINCPKGQIKFKGLIEPDISPSSFSFTYDAANNDLKLNFKTIKIGQATIAFKIQISEQIWHSTVKVSRLNFNYLKPYLHYYLFENTDNNLELLDNTSARISFTAKTSGIIGSQSNNTISWLQSLQLSGSLKNGQYQYDDNMADNLSLHFTADITQRSEKSSLLLPSDNYQISAKITHVKGEILQNDIYLVPTGDEQINAQLTYYSKNQSVHFSRINFSSKDIFSITAKGKLSLKDTDKFSKLNAAIAFLDLAAFNKLYIANFLADTDYEGLQIEGAVKADIIKDEKKVKLHVTFDNFVAAFDQQFSLIDLNGAIHWNNANQKTSPVAQSWLSWQELTLNQLPLSRVTLNFSSHHDFLTLDKEVDIPLFDGALHINSLKMSKMFAALPDYYKLPSKKQTDNGFTLTIDGFIKPISLELVSNHFDWPLLDGTLSAVIPSTTYNEKYLKVGGALMMQVFDGNIIVKDLEIVEPLKDYAQLSANIDLNNLNLQSLTKTYNFGEIQGRVEGKLSQLELSGWQPVAFDAYIRTPENDKSSHRISQRAIDNLSSLGGASGLLSRSFLSFFETFRYDKIGLSCKLINNTCHMSGVEAKGDSYYIVKGGGIPRIDVMGFQKRVNWQVLTSRLKAIQHANEAIIE